MHHWGLVRSVGHRVALLQVSSLSAKQIFPQGRVDELEDVQNSDVPSAPFFSETQELQESQTHLEPCVFESACPGMSRHCFHWSHVT
jgi:hypothetical protein